MNLRSLFQFSVIARLSLGLIALIISLLMIADLLFNVIPDRDETLRESRQHTVENLAVQIVVLLESNNIAVLGKTLQEVALRNPDILSIGIRKISGEMLLQRGDHERYWVPPLSGKSTTNHLVVPIYSKQQHWGDIEISYAYLGANGLQRLISSPTFMLITILGLVGGGLIYIYMRRAMQYLDPSTAVPSRVRKAFDILNDGIVVLDKNGRIVLVNESFKNLIPDSNIEVNGKRISELGVTQPLARNASDAPPPWEQALKSQLAITDQPLSIRNKNGDVKEMLVSAQPITDDGNSVRGYLVSFNDISALHESNLQLRQALAELKNSRAQMEKYNQELELMATRDPLTGCLNRRSFFDKAENSFAMALQGNKDLFCIMADIDHFKSFNDLYGHHVGDQVIQAVARAISSNLRPTDLFCRYGGEEFCIVLENLTLNEVEEISERIRKVIERTGSASIRNTDVENITMSFGVASIVEGATTLEELIEQADNALYMSKESGRNRVTVWKQPEYH